MKRPITRRPVCLICLIFLMCVYVFARSTLGISPYFASFDNKPVTVTGIVCDRQIKNEVLTVYLKSASFDGDDHTSGVILKLNDPDALSRIKLGSTIEARGVFTLFDVPRCEGQFDIRTYYLIRGYEGQVIRARLIGVSEKYDYFSQMLRTVRDRSFDVLRENMSEEDAGLVAAMTLGDKSGLDPDIKELYQLAGISHILALSGLHIASVGLAVLKILKRTGIPGRIAEIISLSLIAVYAVMTGLSVSTVRAMIMFGLFVIASVIGRSYDLLSAASLSAIMILMENPYYIYDTGFLLSFGAVLGIACVYPVIAGIPALIMKGPCRARIGRVLLKTYECMCISISVTVVTLPVIAENYMQISLCSVLINLIVVPLAGMALFTGFLGMILGNIGIKPHVILMITHFILRLYELLAQSSTKIYGSLVVLGQPGEIQKITYAVIVIFVVIWRNSQFFNNTGKANSIDRSGRTSKENNGRNIKKSQNKIAYIIETEEIRTRRRRKNIFGSITMTGLLMIAAVILTLHPRHDMEIRNVDVGQGDCALVWGKDIPTLMIDAGSSDIKQAAKYRIIPVLKANRITTVDMCLISHMDSDHVNALIEMLEDDSDIIGIRRMVITSEACFSDSENYSRLIAGAASKHIPVNIMSKGDKIEAGKLKITCISPDRIVSGNEAGRMADENDASMVLRLERRDPKTGKVFSALFTGDAGSSVEKRIGDIGPVSYLKVAHHGSRNSSDPEFIRNTVPSISVISAGVDNSYGHPHAETLATLRSIGSRIYCTNESGQITVLVDGVSASVAGFLSGM
ncbi:MAG: DNA internalization-related competence protein ComEC/Rec2 [Lachnospiraceae bacterium]|nr:DNA internalization-related competence protein ComEC/Rec2 [Lachnospiraceae bacterium]